MRGEKNGWLAVRRTIKDEAIIMLDKLHAIGYKPILLLGKKTKEQTKCEILSPRCSLSAFAQDYLQKIGSFYEYLCEGGYSSETATSPWPTSSSSMDTTPHQLSG